jgi:hypothetical protein
MKKKNRRGNVNEFGYITFARKEQTRGSPVVPE